MNSHSRRSLSTAAFWLIVTATVISGLWLFWLERPLPGIGILFGGALLASVCAVVSGQLTVDRTKLDVEVFTRSIRVALVLGAIAVAGVGLLLRGVHPGFLSDLLAIWIGPQLVIGSAAILVILRTRARTR